MVDVPSAPEPYRFREPRQARIYARLLLVGENAAAFYRDVCQLLDGTVRLETGTHTIAFNLREIESAIRDVLLPLVDPARLREARRRAKGKNKATHREEVEALLETLGLTGIPRAAETWRQLAFPEGDTGLHRLAHRDNLAGPRSLSDAFRQLVDDVEELLDVVLDRFEARYVSYTRRLDRLLAVPAPTTADIEELQKQIPNSLSALGYFFDRIAHPAWVAPLRRAGFFRKPPEPIHDDGNTIRLPRWPASRWLARMAAVGGVQTEVLEIVMEIPPTKNPRVHEDLADVALALPPVLAELLIPRTSAWIATPHHGLLPEKLGDLLARLARAGRVEAALQLASTLLAVQTDPRGPMLNPAGEAIHWPEAVCHFDLWHYERILDKSVPDLMNVAGVEGFTRLCNVLEDAVRLSRRPEEDSDPEDYSYVWRRSLNDAQFDTLREVLVTAVRRAAEQLVQSDPRRLPLLVQRLEARPWRIFHRLALHLLRVSQERSLDLAAERLTQRALFDAIGLRREYRLLLRERFGDLSPETRAVILAWIEAGPDREQVATTLQSWSGAPVGDTEIDSYINRWRVEQLAILVPQLPEIWKRRYAEWKGDGPEPEDPLLTVQVSAAYGSRSPKSAEEFRAMTVGEIIVFLNSWTPPNDVWAEPSRGGLETAFTAAVEAEPGRFAADAMSFVGVGPAFLTALLWGLRNAIKDPSWTWAPVIDLCSVIADPTDGPPEGKREWLGARLAVASLIVQGLRREPSTIPLSLRGRVWLVLEALAGDPDPTPKDEARRGSQLEAATLSINTVRGEAMHGVIAYALWIRRDLDQQPDAEEKRARGFGEMPEVRETLDAHLDRGRDPSLAIRSVFGRWFPWLALLDRVWTAAHVPAIFPSDPSLGGLRDAAWDTYVTSCLPYDDALPLLEEEYRRAAARVGLKGRTKESGENPDEALANHLTTFYARGKIPLEDSRGPIATFFAHAPVELRRRALARVGRALAREQKPVPPVILERMTCLWAARFEAIRTAAKPPDDGRELEAFGSWFTSGAFDDTWVLGELERVLERTGRIDTDHAVISRLAELCSATPRAAAICIRHMVQGDRDGWVVLGSSEQIRVIADHALKSEGPEAKAAGVHLVNVLVAQGHPEFKELLSD